MTTLSKNKKLIDSHCLNRFKQKYHILEKNDDIWYGTLNQTNISDNSNKFYIIQLLKHDQANSYCLFTRAGRVGYPGKINYDLYVSVEDALTDFKTKFYEKTGTYWEKRQHSKHNLNKYDYIEMKQVDI